MAEVYTHTCPNGLTYVGWTRYSMEERFEQHSFKAQQSSDLPFHKAIRENGEDGFRSRVVFEGSDEACKAEEIRLIAAMGTLEPYGYNATVGGEGGYDDLSDLAKERHEVRTREASALHENRANVAARATAAKNPGLIAEALYEAALSRRSRNGVEEPLPGSTGAKVWSICDRLKAELGRDPKHGEVKAETDAAGINGGGGGAAFYDWRRFHADELPRPPLGKTASICLAIMDREGREVRYGEFIREAQAAGLNRPDPAFRNFRNWYRAANEEQRAAFREALNDPETFRREADLAAGKPTARIHATCDAIFAEGREPTRAELRRLLPDIGAGTIETQLTKWRRKAHREAAAAKLAAE